MKEKYRATFAPQLEFIGGLNATYIKSIKDYASSDYYEHLNRMMTAKLPLSGIYEQIYNNLMTTFTMVPRLAHPVVVWRGIRAKELETGRLVRQFVSTSFSLDSALRQEFTWSTCCVLKITLPSGAQVLPIDEVAEQAGEFEVLLPPDGTWTVLSAEDVPYPPSRRWVKTYDLTYIPKQHVSIDAKNPQATTRQLVKLTDDENIQRIISMYDHEELEFIHGGDKEEYITFLAKHIGAIPMPPMDAILAQIPPPPTQ